MCFLMKLVIYYVSKINPYLLCPTWGGGHCSILLMGMHRSNEKVLTFLIGTMQKHNLIGKERKSLNAI